MENNSEPVMEEKREVRGEKNVGREAFLISGSILLGSLIIAGAILSLNPKSTLPSLGQNTDTTGDKAAVNNPTNKNVSVSIDNDPVLGNKKKAKVAIVEFSDYECPFCKQFHATTFDTLVKDYVDTGKAIVVFRDFPLSFHNPKATLEAGVAECVRKVKGDAAYFAFGKNLYENTQANGKGLVEGKLDDLISKAGATPSSVNKCAESKEITDEIQKDISDGEAIGVGGTPSFVVGTLDEKGMVTGELIVGAQSVDQFKRTIERYLSK